MGWTDPGLFARNLAGSRPDTSVFVDQHGEAGHGIRDVFYRAHDDFLGRGAVVGERLSPVRLLAVCLGLVGAIVHTKPWTGELSPWMGLAILAAMVYAAYQLVTRMLPQNVKIGAAVTGLQLAYLFGVS